MKLIFSILFVLIVIISGCKNVDDEIETELNTIQQASLESGIPSADIIYTKEITDNDAFSLFQIPDGYGVLHFTNKEDGWGYRGHSGFQYDIGDITSFTLSQSAWHKGDNSLDKDSLYTTVFLGEIIDPDIDKIIVEYDNINREASIVKNKDRTFWYLLSEQEDGNESINMVSAYSSEGKLLYIEEG